MRKNTPKSNIQIVYMKMENKKIKEVDNNDYYKSTDTENKENAKEIQGNEITKQNDKNYGRSKGLYSENLLKKGLRQHFITIPHSTQNHQILLDNLTKCSKNMKYLCVAKEKHAEGGEHYHILITATRGITIAQIHKRIMETEGNIAGSINYQQVSTLKAVDTYIKKDGNYKEWGEIATQKYNKDTKDAINEDLNEIYNNDQTIEKNIEQIKSLQPAYYTQYANAITKELEKKDEKVYKRYTAPSFKDTVLRPYQQRIWNLLNEQPQNRRIIWVCGTPNTGKSYMMNYITEKHDYGVYNVGQSASLDNAVYGYNNEGVIAWDIPKNFNYNDMGDALASTIEKFSDFGQHLTSKKYQGKKTQVLGHVIVFSNRHVLPQLKHRDIIPINTRDDETEAEKLAHHNVKMITKKGMNKGQPFYEMTTQKQGQEDERQYFYKVEDLPPQIQEDVYDLYVAESDIE